MAQNVTEAHLMSNVHPGYRRFHLWHIAQLRRMAREGRYTVDCRRIIRETQRAMLRDRRALAAARVALAGRA